MRIWILRQRLWKIECKVKREELIHSYEKAQKIKVQPKLCEQNLNTDIDLSERMKQDKSELEQILKNYNSLNKELNGLNIEENLKGELNQQVNEFQKDFVFLNCEIQNLRMQTQSYVDQIKTNKEEISLIHKDLEEKEKLIKYFNKHIDSYLVHFKIIK